MREAEGQDTLHRGFKKTVVVHLALGNAQTASREQHGKLRPGRKQPILGMVNSESRREAGKQYEQRIEQELGEEEDWTLESWEYLPRYAGCTCAILTS